LSILEIFAKNWTYESIFNYLKNEIVDIDDGEAEKLIKLIELLIEKWYISRHDEEELLNTIINIKNEKLINKQSKV